MAEYINIKHWYDMYSKISERVFEITVELASYDNPVLTREEYIKEGELIALNAVKSAMVDANVLPEDIAPVEHCDWIQTEYGDYRCSACNIEWFLDDGAPEIKYCPNCGAKLEVSR